MLLVFPLNPRDERFELAREERAISVRERGKAVETQERRERAAVAAEQVRREGKVEVFSMNDVCACTRDPDALLMRACMQLLTPCHSHSVHS